MLAGCGGPAVTPDTPPEILYGEDVCAQCGMIISDERFAAGLVVELAPDVYEHRIFDDIGGMLTYVQEHAQAITIVAYFVHDYNSKEWINAESAYFVRSNALHTPMGYGLAACAQELEAQALAEEWQGELLTFAQLNDGSAGYDAPQSHLHSD
ncbi:MAG: nitrous oxide reductase accessory protein NosL [Caldilineaceae bacterium]